MGFVVITGANRGIGLELARAYAADGHRVLAGVRDPARAEALASIAGVELRPVDAADPASLEAFARSLDGEVVDVLINNAGIMGPEQQTARGVDPEGWVSTLKVNALGPVLLTLGLADCLARSGRPVAATITSQMGSIADNTSGGYYAYRMSKAAVNMGVKSLSLDLKDRGICCVVLHPGWVKTDMGGAGAPLSPVDSARSLKRLIDDMTLDRTGRFYAYDGRELPW